jgi:uncharacterized membrane protein
MLQFLRKFNYPILGKILILIAALIESTFYVYLAIQDINNSIAFYLC